MAAAGFVDFGPYQIRITSIIAVEKVFREPAEYSTRVYCVGGVAFTVDHSGDNAGPTQDEADRDADYAAVEAAV